MIGWLRDLVQRLFYLGEGRLFNRPAVLTAWVQALGKLGLRVALSEAELAAVCLREQDFSSRAHEAGLIAGPFVIGMDSCPFQRRERMAASGPLPDPQRFGRRAAIVARRRSDPLEARVLAGEDFDLVNDYLPFLAWGALGGIFDARARRSVVLGTPGPITDADLRALFFDLRWVGAHLVVEPTAPLRVRRRAADCAARLNSRVARALPEIAAYWAAKGWPQSAQTAHRQAVGLMWVGHPAMVQAGANLMQELLARPAVYAALRERVHQAGSGAYRDAGLRLELRGHVLECNRLRPPFPLLARLLPRDASAVLAGRVKSQRAGGSILLGVSSALRDGAAFPQPQAYEPGRTAARWQRSHDEVPIFGIGPRSCIAREQVVEYLVSALIGLLVMPELRYADPWYRRIGCDGVVITRMRLKMR